MTILDWTTFDRALFHVDKLIAQPLQQNGNYQIDEYDNKQFADLIQDCVENPNKFTQQLASDFGHYTKNWDIDWHWIAFHILWDFYNFRQAKSIYDQFGPEAKVFKQLDTTTIPGFQQLYLTDPNNSRSEPKIFTLSELMGNGSNLGKPPYEWKPVIGITDFGYYKYHPYDDVKNEIETGHYIDNSTLTIKPLRQIWDEDARAYKHEDKPLTDRQKKIRSLIKINVTIDGKTMSMDEWKRKNKS